MRCIWSHCYLQVDYSWLERQTRDQVVAGSTPGSSTLSNGPAGHIVVTCVPVAKQYNLVLRWKLNRAGRAVSNNRLLPHLICSHMIDVDVGCDYSAFY